MAGCGEEAPVSFRTKEGKKRFWSAPLQRRFLFGGAGTEKERQKR
jgi:hypothetical protein